MNIYKISITLLVLVVLSWCVLSCDNRDDEKILLTLEAVPDTMYADNGETWCELRATLTDDNGNPFNEEEVCFEYSYDVTYEDALHIGPLCDNTDSTGVAIAVIVDKITLPIDFTFIAQVTATWENLSATVPIKIMPKPEKLK